MEIMKKYYKFVLLATVAFFVLIANIGAIEVNEEFGGAEEKKLSYSANFKWHSKNHAGWLSYDNHIYKTTSKKDGKVYEIYCMDPGAGYGKPLKIVRALEPSNPKDLMILRALNYEANTDELRMAKSIALRVLIYGFTNYGYSPGTVDSWKIDGLKLKALEWCNLDLKDSFNCSNIPKGDQSHKIQQTGTVDVFVKARAIVKEAVEGKDTLEEAVIAPTSTSEKLEDGSTKYTIEFDLSSLTGTTPEFGIKSIDVGDSSVSSVTYSFSPDDEGSNIAYDTNLLSGENKKVYINLVVSLPETEFEDEEEDACAGGVKINYFYDGDNNLTGFVLHEVNSDGTDASGYQRFLILGDGKAEGTYDLSLTCDYDCSSVGMPNVCEDGSTPDENGNVAYEYKEAFNNGNYNIKKCLLKTKTDSAGNSVKLIDDDIIANNPYCEVVCKEDYNLVVPYKRETFSGRYFQISASINGKHSCYSTKIESEKFEKDNLNNIKAMVDSYNEWAENYELANNDLVNSETVSCEEQYSGTCTTTNSDGTTSSNCCAKSAGTSTETKKKVTFKLPYYTVDTNGKISEKGKPTSPDFGYFKTSGKTCDGSVTCKWTTPEDDRKSKNYDSKASSAATKLENAINEFKETIDKYNACAGDEAHVGISDAYSGSDFWKMEYKFEPEVTYDYDEPEPGISSTRWADDADRTMVSEDLTIGEVTTTFIDGDINNDYSPSDGSKVNGTNFESKTFGYCEGSGNSFTCSNRDFEVTTVDYVSKEAEANASYRTKRVYYSHHTNNEIIIKDSEDFVDENYDRVNGLPVSINTLQGKYFYTLAFESMGRFYDSESMGRIYGSGENAIVAKYLEGATTEDNTQVNANEYACSYDVSQNSCVDNEGKVHTSLECNKGEDWDSCQQRICNCTECIIECAENCSYVRKKVSGNRSGLTVDFRTISRSNMNPNNRDYGYNWNSKNPVNVLVAQKAGNTITEIEKRSIVDVDAIQSPEMEDVNDYTLKVTMTPKMIRALKEYNNSQEANGGYNNQTMTCYDFTVEISDEKTCEDSGFIWKKDKCTMSNIFCYSEVIDCLVGDKCDISELSDPDFKVEMANNDARSSAKLVANNNYSKFKTYTNPSVPNLQGSIYTNDYWTIYKFDNMDINGDKISDVGPSWK